MVYLQNKLQMPDLVSCFEGLRCIWTRAAATIYKNLQRQQGLLAWAVDSAVHFYHYFFFLRGFVCFTASAGQRTVIKRRVQLKIAKYHLKIDD